MRSLLSLRTTTVLFLAAVGCHVDDLVDAPPTGSLIVTPAAVQVSAEAGSSAPREVTLAVRSAEPGTIEWTVGAVDAEWIVLDGSAGTTPDSLTLTFDPSGLPPGRYVDTLVFEPDDPDVATTRIPVTLIVVAQQRLSFTQRPTTTSAGLPITPAPKVAVVDGEGDVVPGYTGTVTLTLVGGAAGATLSGDRTVSVIDGVATFTGLSIDKVGSGYTLRATATGLQDATSAPFVITSGAASRLTFTIHPSTTSTGAAITPAVEITAYDGYGNLATSFTGAVSIAIANDGSLLQNAQLGGTKTRNAAAGVVRFADLTIDQPGTGYTLGVSAGGVSGDTSNSFGVSPIGGSPTAQEFGQQPSSASAGAPISPPVTVRIVDALGALVPGFSSPVTLTLIDGTSGAVLGGTTSRAPSDGVARFDDLVVDRPGSGYRLRASAAALPAITSAPFSITPPPPTTGAIQVSVTTTGSDLDPDGYTAVVSGVSRSLGVNDLITYESLAAATYTAALNGVASNCSVAGSNPRNVAVIAGDTALVDFSVTCQGITPPPTATQLQFTTQPPSVMVVGSGFGVLVAGTDANGDEVPTFTGQITLTLVGGLPGVSLTGTTSRAAVGGVATFLGLGVSGPCVGCRILASSSPLTPANSDPFTVALPGLAP